MAKTKDPHAASLKAWDTRGRKKPGPITKAHEAAKREDAKRRWGANTWAEFKEKRHQAALKAAARRKANAAGVAPAQLGVGRVDATGQRSLGIGTGKVGGPTVSRGDWQGNKWLDTEERVRTTPQKSAKVLGGGVSESYEMYLEDGTHGNFKPSSGELGSLREGIEKGQMAERELGAWELAKLVGMDDMVAPVVIRECDVPGGGRKPFGGKYSAGMKRGSFAVWQDGHLAADVGPARAYDGKEDLERAALFDYIIGMQDRHPGNWVMSKEGKLKLIDHGLAFGEKGNESNNRLFEMELRRKYGASQPPKALIDSYVKNKSKILLALSKLRLPEDAVERVGMRIDKAAVATTWRDFLGARD